MLYNFFISVSFIRAKSSCCATCNQWGETPIFDVLPSAMAGNTHKGFVVVVCPVFRNGIPNYSFFVHFLFRQETPPDQHGKGTHPHACKKRKMNINFPPLPKLLKTIIKFYEVINRISLT